MMSSPGFSQPVFGPEISTVGSYSREGYTSKTFISPTVPFKDQVTYVETDEDIQHSLHKLSSLVTGGAHYWKCEIESVNDLMTQFSTDIDLDWLDTIMVKELLAYGNTVWKPRLGIQHIRNKEDLMQIPISSFVRMWWDRQRRAYKYEFRGADYQGYHNREDIIHLIWNPVNASPIGTGFMTALASTKEFYDQTPTGETLKTLASLMDRKYSMAMLTHLNARRYSPRNVYKTQGASDSERAQLRADLADLDTNEDIIVGKGMEVQELGLGSKGYDPAQFQDTVQGQIQKATNDFSGKQGSESSHQYANAEQAEDSDQIGLASFPLAVSRQLIEQLFEPWYESNGGQLDPCYGGGLVSIPWKEANPTLEFGRLQKKDIDPETMMKLLEIGIQAGALPDPAEVREILEDAGLGIRKQYTESLVAQYNNPMAYPPDFNTYAADNQAPRPQDDPNYTSSQRFNFQEPPVQSMDATYGHVNPYVSNQPGQGTYWTSTGNAGSVPKQTFRKAFNKLEIDDINAWMSNSGNAETVEDIDKKIKETELAEKQLKLEQRKKIQETLDILEQKDK